MRPLEELSDAELAALSDEDIELYTDIACALQGVPLLPPAPAEPKKPDAEPDLTVYEVGGLLFWSQADATVVCENLNGIDRVKAGYGGYREFGPNVSIAEHFDRSNTYDSGVLTVTPKPMYTREHYEAVKARLDLYNRQRKEYEKQKKEYDEAVSTRDEAREELMMLISSARARQREREQLTALWERYLQLADGNAATARKFMLNANPHAADVLPELFSVDAILDSAEVTVTSSVVLGDSAEGEVT